MCKCVTDRDLESACLVCNGSREGPDVTCQRSKTRMTTSFTQFFFYSSKQLNPPTPPLACGSNSTVDFWHCICTINTVPSYKLAACTSLPLFLCPTSFLTASSQPARRPAPDAGSPVPAGPWRSWEQDAACCLCLQLFLQLCLSVSSLLWEGVWQGGRTRALNRRRQAGDRRERRRETPRSIFRVCGVGAGCCLLPVPAALPAAIPGHGVGGSGVSH